MSELDLTEAIEAAEDAVTAEIGPRPDISSSNWTIAEAAVRAAAPIIERAVRLTEARRLLTEARAHEERYGDGTEGKWDRGFAAGMGRAAHSLANDADREAK